MALAPDDTVCFCFHVTLRKIEAFCVREQPAAASRISECLSAGTGCGWCVPMLRKIHTRCCPDRTPWWRTVDDAALPDASAADWQAGRAEHLRRKQD